MFLGLWNSAMNIMLLALVENTAQALEAVLSSIVWYTDLN